MKNLKLYNYNEPTYNNVVQLWSKGVDRVGVVQATGTGKSYVITRCCAYFEGKKVLVLAPKVHILNSLESHMGSCKAEIEYMTYTKLNLVDGDDMSKICPDLIVLDEFHRCGSNAWGKATSRLLEMYPNAKVLGTTATSVRYLDGCRDMAMEIFDNNLACNSNLLDAINEGVLPAPTYITSLYSLDEELATIEKKISKDDENYGIVVDKLEKLKDWNTSVGVPNILRKHLDGSTNKFIIFCKSESHLNAVYSTVIKWFEEAKILDGVKDYKITFKNAKNNDKCLEEFRNGDDKNIHLLFSIDILNEGLHIDDCGVILLRETGSPIVYLQQIGRALSVSNDSPIIFDFVNNFSSLKIVEFENMIEESAQRLKQQGRKSSEPVDFKLYDETRPIRELLEELTCLIADNWEISYNRLVSYCEKHGSSVIFGDNKEYHSLYMWCNRQRHLYSKGMLSDDKVEKLNALNFPWDLKFWRWMLNYNKLKSFYKLNKTVKVTDSIDSKLSAWCGKQRSQKHLLSEIQIKLLEELGFKWNVLDEEFEEKIQELLEYKAEYGDLLVPRRYEKNPKLANWVHRVRSPRDKAVLSEYKLNRLNEIGFVWDVEDYNWNLKFNELSNFYKEINYKGEKKVAYPNKPLGDWCNRQRVAYRSGRLSEERINKLESINFIFKVK